MEASAHLTSSLESVGSQGLILPLNCDPGGSPGAQLPGCPPVPRDVAWHGGLLILPCLSLLGPSVDRSWLGDRSSRKTIILRWKNFIEHTTNVCSASAQCQTQCDNAFTSIPFHPFDNPVGWDFPSPFTRWGNRGSEGQRTHNWRGAEVAPGYPSFDAKGS